MTEQGATMMLTVNAETQFAINEQGVQRRGASIADLKAGATVEVEYTADGVARVIIVDIKPSSDKVQPTPTRQSEPPKTQATPTKQPELLKAKGVIKGIEVNVGGSARGTLAKLTIQPEKGDALMLTVNAETQFAINEQGVQRRGASIADLKVGATVEVEYTADGVARAIIQNIRA
ncbi:MAG: hypothetical protein EXR53_02390 [Dehalococcoidia bacterium]|nr:hypothetical protein [Dehalococcoidia bacterium]